MERIKVNRRNFDIAATLECGQVFRYRREGNGYFVCSLGRRAFLYYDGDDVAIESDDAEYFANYFDLAADYGAIEKTLSAFPELRSAVEYGKGIRILRQDLFEATMSFIVSANNNIARIKGIIERLCDRYGTDKGGYRAFPTPTELARATVDELKEIGLGYRAEYIYESCRDFARVEEELRHADAPRAHEILLTMKGVGPKVADCIVLFGLHLTRSYPVDTWIFKASSTPQLDTPAKVRDYYLDRYGEYAGFAQQYIFYEARSQAKKRENT